MIKETNYQQYLQSKQPSTKEAILAMVEFKNALGHKSLNIRYEGNRIRFDIGNGFFCYTKLSFLKFKEMMEQMPLLGLKVYDCPFDYKTISWL